jgi:hypothetical protein
MLGNLPTAATRVALPFLLLALGGCNHLELMNPKGSIGAQEKDLILIALGLAARRHSRDGADGRLRLTKSPME